MSLCHIKTGTCTWCRYALLQEGVRAWQPSRVVLAQNLYNSDASYTHSIRQRVVPELSEFSVRFDLSGLLKTVLARCVHAGWVLLHWKYRKSDRLKAQNCCATTFSGVLVVRKWTTRALLYTHHTFLAAHCSLRWWKVRCVSCIPTVLHERCAHSNMVQCMVEPWATHHLIPTSCYPQFRRWLLPPNAMSSHSLLPTFSTVPIVALKVTPDVLELLKSRGKHERAGKIVLGKKNVCCSWLN